MTIQPGDVLLYQAKGVYGWIIRFHTGHPIAHVECYIGNGRSVASRDGKGTGNYELRLDGLVTVCRPRVPYNLQAGLAWLQRTGHRPYGWLDLAQFADLPFNTNGIVCSPFVTEFARACGYDPFNGEPAEKVAPFMFETSVVYQIIPYVAGAGAPPEVV
jgi:hypothetical protein